MSPSVLGVAVSVEVRGWCWLMYSLEMMSNHSDVIVQGEGHCRGEVLLRGISRVKRPVLHRNNGIIDPQRI